MVSPLTKPLHDVYLISYFIILHLLCIGRQFSRIKQEFAPTYIFEYFHFFRFLLLKYKLCALKKTKPFTQASFYHICTFTKNSLRITFRFSLLLSVVLHLQGPLVFYFSVVSLCLYGLYVDINFLYTVIYIVVVFVSRSTDSYAAIWRLVTLQNKQNIC